MQRSFAGLSVGLAGPDGRANVSGYVQKYISVRFSVHTVQHRQQTAANMGQPRCVPCDGACAAECQPYVQARYHQACPYSYYWSPLRVFGQNAVECLCLLCLDAVENGHIKRITDGDIQSSVLEIASANVATTFIKCPSDPDKTLGIKLPFLVMIIKNMNKYFSFEVQVLDDKNVRRRFRASNYQVSGCLVHCRAPYKCRMEALASNVLPSAELPSICGLTVLPVLG